MFTTTMEKQKQLYRTGVTLELQYRMKQLDKLEKMLMKAIPQLLEAVRMDLRKSPVEAYMSEIIPVLEELRHTKKNLRKWIRPKGKSSTLLSPFSRYQVVAEPKGQVLIIAPFNYPIQLALIPLVSALAAGNTVILKLSEQSVHTGKLLEELLNGIYGENLVFATRVAPDQFEDLMELAYDHIFFTGSTRIGREIMKGAGSKLTTLTLELGGKSPVIIHPLANMKKAAKRIAWGKCLNSGQTCIAPDYLLVEKSVKDVLLTELRGAFQELYPNPLENEDYPKIINRRQFDRLKGYLQGEKIIFGGGFDATAMKVEPTLVDEPRLNSDLMKDEIFGPILPVLVYEGEQELVNLLAMNPDPLALYVFAEDRRFIRWVNRRISFGSGAVNDVLVQILSPTAPFGGRGASGMGSYHGEYGFAAFSHYKTLVQSPMWFDLPLRYPPYSEGLLKLLRKIYR